MSRLLRNMSLSGPSRRTDVFGDKIPGMMSSKERAAYEGTGVALRPSRILKRVWLGDRSMASQEDVLTSCGITHILNLHSSAVHPSKDFRYLHYPMSDSGKDDLNEVMDDIAEFVKEALATGSLLIHCNLGQNRSVSVTIALLLRVEQSWELESVLAFVAARHHQFFVHKRYMRQLEKMASSRGNDDEHKYGDSD